MTRPAKSKSSRFLLTGALLSALAGAALLGLDLFPDLQTHHRLSAMAASFAPYGILAWALAIAFTLLGARGRTRLIALPLAVGFAGQAALLSGYFPATPASAAGGSTLKVIELNLQFGLANLDELAQDVERLQPDVLVLTEVTKSNAKTFESKSWRSLLPNQVGTAGRDSDQVNGSWDASGTMVLSKHPLTQLQGGQGTVFTNFAARVELPDAPFVIVAAHPSHPVRSLDQWLSDASTVTGLAVQHSGGRLLVVGDLNATAEHVTYRELRAKARLTDAGAGFGWQPTYPADAWHPPLIQIDHVLASKHFATTAYQTFKVAGTDHLGIRVTLSVS